jgi:hypothetical protein
LRKGLPLAPLRPLAISLDHLLSREVARFDREASASRRFGLLREMARLKVSIDQFF